MFQLPSDFQPTDEYAKSKLGMSLADYYSRNPGAQDAYNNSPSQVARRQQDTLAAQQKAQSDLLAQQKIDTQNQFNQSKSDITDFNTRYGAAVPQVINDTSNKYQLGDLLGQTNALNTRVKDLQGNLTNQGAGGCAGVY